VLCPLSAKVQTPANFHILSYNISGYSHYKKPKEYSALEKFLSDSKAEVICLQEFFPPEYKNKSKRQLRNFKKTAFLEEYPFQFVSAFPPLIGVATFSKFPIIAKGILFEGKNTHNRGIFTDIVIGKDTLRIINVHLESNQLNWFELFTSEHNFVKALHIIKKKQPIRSKQTILLKRFIKESPYKSIITGDFNEFPLSYTYFAFKRFLKNGFEEKGRGLGVSFRPGKSFLRIDHQFFSKGIEINSYKTISDAPYSDHVPIEGGYSIY